MQLENTSIQKNESVDTGLFEVDDTLPKFGYPKVLPALGKVVVEMASKQRMQALGASNKKKAAKIEKPYVILGKGTSNNPIAITNMIRERNQRFTMGITQ